MTYAITVRHHARLAADGRKMHCPACEVGWNGSHLRCWCCDRPGVRGRVGLPGYCVMCSTWVAVTSQTTPWDGGLIHRACEVYALPNGAA